MTNIIDGQAIAESVQQELKVQVAAMLPLKPSLVVILVGEDIASQTYVRMKSKACDNVGITSRVITLPKDVAQKELLVLIEGLNKDPQVHGILVQLPLPAPLDTSFILECISPDKDVDGVHPLNMGKLLSDREEGFEPCTPKGICHLLQYSNISTQGKHVVIVGRSNIVGRPLAAMLLRKGPQGNATVTVAHSHTKNLVDICRSADILVAAIGQPHFIKSHMVRPGSVVIDVGINAIAVDVKSGKRKLVGDVDFAAVAPLCSAITPVPKGVGPMTIAMLLSNTILSCKRFAKGANAMKNLTLFLLMAFFCISCTQKDPILFQGNAMTIDYRVLVGHALSTEEKHNVKSLINMTFDEINAIYNKWNIDSELSRLNQLPAQQKYVLSPQMASFLQETAKIVQWTEGRFDPTVEPLQALWKEALQKGTEPQAEEIAAILPSIGWNHIHIEDGIFYKDRAETQLDLGGIAKGYCIDLLIDRLQKIGYGNLLVDWGSDLRAIGKHPSGRCWHIAVRDVPSCDTQNIACIVDANDIAVAGSGDYLQYWNVRKEESHITYFHILDPKSGRPLQIHASSIAGTSVLASNCFFADALATTGMLFSSAEEAQSWVQRHSQQLPSFKLLLLYRNEPSVEIDHISDQLFEKVVSSKIL